MAFLESAADLIAVVYNSYDYPVVPGGWGPSLGASGHGDGGLRMVRQGSPFIFQFAFHCIPVMKLISSTRNLQAS